MNEEGLTDEQCQFVRTTLREWIQIKILNEKGIESDIN